MHKTTLTTLSTLTLLLLPLASAGPGGSVDTLDASGGCAYEYDQWSSGNGTNESGWWAWSRSASHACSDHMDYAAVEAHDDAGTLARASVTADHANGSAYGENGGGSWWDGHSSSYANQYHERHDAWNRRAALDTRAGSANVTYGCSESSSGQAGWSDSGWNDSYASSYNDHSAYASRCGADVGTPAGAAFVGQRCSDSRYYGSWTTWRAEGRETHAHDGASSSCFTGAESSAASAGYGSACFDGSGRHAHEWYAENATQERSWSASSCRSGVGAAGPDGILVFAGTEAFAYAWCDEVACESFDQTAVVGRLTWEHNPLGPSPVHIVYVPLP